MTMLPLEAHVKNGRLVLDEPTDLPEGEVIELVPLHEEERAALHAELEASVAEARAGQLVDADVVMAELAASR
jgi:hypothetical protein